MSEETSIEVPPLRNIDCKLRSLTESEACGSSTLRGATDMLPGECFYKRLDPCFISNITTMTDSAGEPQRPIVA